MIVNKQLAESKGHLEKDKWETPAKVFKILNDEFGFTLDPCCEVQTAKASTFYTPLEDGLSKDWSGHTVFVNPPYSRYNIGKWVKKCCEEGKKTTVVALLPVSDSAKWWHTYICAGFPGNHSWNELRFVKGRIKFVGARFTAPFSSVIVIWKPSNTTA